MKSTYIILIVSLWMRAAYAADKTPTLAEAKAQYKTADAELNKAYSAAIAELDKSKAGALREDERGWIQYRDEMMEANYPPDNGPATKDPEYWQTLALFEQDRAKFLKAYSGKHVPAGISGEYSDSYGGTLELKETKQGEDFSIEAVRGRGMNQGDIEGSLQFHGDSAYFKQKLDDTEKDSPPCELAFKVIDGHIIKIEEKAPDSLAGMGVHYDGAYYKTGEVKKE
jgi:uncharacterized protein YecT (DUF1311 family)